MGASKLRCPGSAPRRRTCFVSHRARSERCRSLSSISATPTDCARLPAGGDGAARGGAPQSGRRRRALRAGRAALQASGAMAEGAREKRSLRAGSCRSTAVRCPAHGQSGAARPERVKTAIDAALAGPRGERAERRGQREQREPVGFLPLPTAAAFSLRANQDAGRASPSCGAPSSCRFYESEAHWPIGRIPLRGGRARGHRHAEDLGVEPIRRAARLALADAYVAARAMQPRAREAQAVLAAEPGILLPRPPREPAAAVDCCLRRVNWC